MLPTFNISGHHEGKHEGMSYFRENKEDIDCTMSCLAFLCTKCYLITIAITITIRSPNLKEREWVCTILLSVTAELQVGLGLLAAIMKYTYYLVPIGGVMVTTIVTCQNCFHLPKYFSSLFFATYRVESCLSRHLYSHFWKGEHSRVMRDHGSIYFSPGVAYHCRHDPFAR